MANKRVAILGCGYVGLAVAGAARAAGIEVEALTRNRGRAAELIRLGVRAIVADLADSSWHAQITCRDFVLDCVGSGGGGLPGYRRSYVEGMRSVLAWARQDPLGTLVFTSSTSVYPQGDGRVVDESAPTDDAGPAGSILLEAEAMLRAANDARRRWFVLRLAGIYGPGRHHLLDEVRSGALTMAGERGRRLNLAHRDDICSAVMALAGSPDSVADEIFNVCDGAPAPKAEVVGWLASQVGLPAPALVGGPAGGRHGVASPPDRIISNAKLRESLGWQPQYRSFKDGYRALLSA